MAIPWFRIVAVAEGLSYVALLAAVAAKRLFDEPGGVDAIGPLHGLLFVAYFASVVFEREERAWSIGRTAVVLLAAVVPLGGFWVERRFLRAAPPPGPSADRPR